MKALIPILALVIAAFALQHTPMPPPKGPPASLPDARERAVIAERNHKKNVEDAARLLVLAAELKSGIDAQDVNTVSAESAKKAKDIEKLARGISKRLTSN